MTVPEMRILEILPPGPRRRMFLYLLEHPEYDEPGQDGHLSFRLWSNGCQRRVSCQFTPDPKEITDRESR